MSEKKESKFVFRDTETLVERQIGQMRFKAKRGYYVLRASENNPNAVKVHKIVIEKFVMNSKTREWKFNSSLQLDDTPECRSLIKDIAGKI